MGKLTKLLKDTGDQAKQLKKEIDTLADQLKTSATNIEQQAAFIFEGIDATYLYVKTVIEGAGGGKKKRNFKLADYKGDKLSTLMDSNLKAFLKGVADARLAAGKSADVWWNLFNSEIGSIEKRMNNLKKNMGDASTSLAKKRKELEKAKVKAPDKIAKIVGFVQAISDLESTIKGSEAIIGEYKANQPPNKSQLEKHSNLTAATTIGTLDSMASMNVKTIIKNAEQAVKNGTRAEKKFRGEDIIAATKKLEKMAKDAAELDD